MTQPERHDRYKPAPWPIAATRLLLRLVVLAAIALTAHFAIDYVMYAIDMQPAERRPALRILAIGAALLVYALLIAVPFVPGIEIGLSLLMLRGAEVAPAVYAATLLGLTLAYLAGRYLPLSVLRRLFLDLRLTGACRLIDQLQPLGPADRLALLRRHLPRRSGGVFLRYRYLWIAVLVNLPGNALIGGGGGIGLMAGLSGVFAPAPTLLSLAAAIAPVPLAVLLIGPGILG